MRTQPMAVAFQEKNSSGISVRESVRRVLAGHKVSLLAAMCASASLVSLPAMGSDAASDAGSTKLVQLARATTYNLDLPAGDLNTSLQELALASQHKLFYKAELVEGKTAPAIKGDYTAEQAIQKLLGGTNLVYEITPSSVVLIKDKDDESSKGIGSTKTSYSRGSAGNLRLSQTENKAKLDAAASKEAAGSRIDEIVVTAQKREERLHDVPISISVLGGDELDSSTDHGATDALNRIPALSATTAIQGGNTVVSIRGIGTGALFSGASTNAFYLDAAPFGLVKSAFVPDPAVYDLDRVEVLRGPQGTLYGANAMNGVVRVLTKDADLNRYEAKARVAGSSTQDGGDGYRADAAVNVPLIEGKLGMRAVAGYQDLSGWVDRPSRKDYNDGINRNFRLKLNASPTDTLSLAAAVWHSQANYDGIAAANTLGIRNVPIDEPQSQGYDLYSFKIGYAFPRFSVTSATSYVDYAGDALKRSDFSANILTQRITSKVFTQEINLISTGDGPFRWSVGGMYRDGEDLLQFGFSTVASLPLQTFPNSYNDLSRSSALFGEVAYSWFDKRLELATGLRYVHETVGVDDNIATSYRPRASFNPVTPRVVLIWRPQSHLTTYASYGQGFRGGFPQNPIIGTGAAPFVPPARPEKLHNYEIGVKTDFLDGRMSLEAAGYYIQWDDVQTTIQYPFGVSFITATINATSASGPGAEFALTFRPAKGLNVGINASWNDVTLDQPLVSAGLISINKGERLANAPEQTYGGFVNYDFPLGSSALRGRLGLSANYRSSNVTPSVLSPTGTVGSDDILLSRASLSAGPQDDRWTVSVFVDNLNNERGTTDGYAPGQQPDITGRLRPRTTGMQLEYHFQ